MHTSNIIEEEEVEKNHDFSTRQCYDKGGPRNRAFCIHDSTLWEAEE